MNHQHSELYKGYRINVEAIPECECWRSIFSLEQSMHRSESAAVTPLCRTPEEAMAQALRFGKKCIDSDGFSLCIETSNRPLFLAKT